ncbi:MAG: Rrf2 family transcriptional regulator [Thermodesulfobacteriota bacterium]
MRLSTRTRYAPFILADVALHQDHGPVQTGEMSRRLGISVKYLEQVIKSLRKAGFVIGVRGPKGGYVLGMEPERLSLGQIARLFGHSDGSASCVSIPRLCPVSNRCIVRLAWERASEDMLRSLSAITLADLIESHPLADASKACSSFKVKRWK